MKSSENELPSEQEIDFLCGQDPIASRKMSQQQQYLLTFMVVTVCLAFMLANQNYVLQTLEWHSSPLDWCEQNYIYSPYIVEFWNSLSSMLLALGGLVGYLVYRNDAYLNKFEPQIYLIWAMMFVVGVGSVYFHGTLSIAGQISDEVPIVILVVLALMMSRPRKEWNSKSRDIALSGHTLVRFTSVITTFCLFFPRASHIFTLFGFPSSLYFFITDYSKTANAKHRQLFWTLMGTFTIAFTAWILDRIACESLTDFGNRHLGGYPQLHAIWHLFMTLTFWLVIALGIMLRAEADQVKATLLHQYGFFPIVSMV